MNTYTTQQKVSDYLQKDLTAYASFISKYISAVEKYIDHYTGTTFKAESETRYYDTNGGRTAVIDFLATISVAQTLSEDGSVATSLTEGTDYRLYPLNEDEHDEIRLIPGSSIGGFPKGDYRLKVKGIWGTATVPEDIELAATKLVAKALQQGMDGGNITSMTLGEYSVSYGKMDEDADSLGIKSILDNYRHIPL